MHVLPIAVLLVLASPADCTAPEHRQFDFWLGEWDVYDPDGEKVGENTITSIHHGCALREEWRSVRDHAGTSLNFFDGKTGRWYQTWIANNGNALHLVGGLEGGAMVLRSREPGERVDRISWTPDDDGSVRQLWDISTDGGETWEVAFDGRYVRKGAE